MLMKFGFFKRLSNILFTQKLKWYYSRETVWRDKVLFSYLMPFPFVCSVKWAYFQPMVSYKKSVLVEKIILSLIDWHNFQVCPHTTKLRNKISKRLIKNIILRFYSSWACVGKMRSNLIHMTSILWCDVIVWMNSTFVTGYVYFAMHEI